MVNNYRASPSPYVLILCFILIATTHHFIDLKIYVGARELHDQYPQKEKSAGNMKLQVVKKEAAGGVFPSRSWTSQSAVSSYNNGYNYNNNGYNYNNNNGYNNYP